MATQNPPGSSDPRDLVVNAGNLDVLVTSKEKLSQNDRLGVPRKTWHAMEVEHEQAQGARAGEFEADQSARASAFASDQTYRSETYTAFLEASGYDDLGEYSPGIEFTARNQYVTYAGQPYLLKPSVPVPYTTAGEWDGEDFKLIGDDALRQDLANPLKGAANIARGVVAVDSIADLLALPAGQRKADLRYLVKGYRGGSNVGGGSFFWDPLSAADVNYGTVFSVPEMEAGRFIRDKGEIVTPESFGAIGNGEYVPLSAHFASLDDAKIVYPFAENLTDSIDWAAGQAQINASGGMVRYRTAGRYYLTRPWLYDTQTTFLSDSPALTYTRDRCATIIVLKATWDGSDSIYKKRARQASYQSCAWHGLAFAGDANIEFNSLHAAEDTGIAAIDVSYIRDGVIIRNCAFRRIGSAVRQIDPIGYLGFVVFDNCHVTNCYKALDCYPTTQLTIINSRIYDCFDWVSSNKVTLINTAFNNSSRASENCGIHADHIYSLSCWYEGGNRWFDTSAALESASIEVVGGIFSEAMSASGGTKFICRLSNTIPSSVRLKSVALPENTRLTDLGPPTTPNSYGNQSFDFDTVSNIGSNWTQMNPTLSMLLSAGLKYSGRNNKPRAGYSDPHLNSTVQREDRLSALSLAVVPQSLGAAGKTFALTANRVASPFQYASTAPGFIELTLMGHNNGAGGNLVWLTKITIFKGMNAVWGVAADSAVNGTAPATALDVNGFSVALAALTSTSCSVTITPTHEGNKAESTVWVSGGSSAFLIV